jgi:hypothetical protein
VARPLAVLAADLPAARRLYDALTARGAHVVVHVADEVRVDLTVRRVDADPVVNLVDEAAAPPVRAFVTEYLAYLADIGTAVVNGLDAFVIGSSRARQLALLAHLGIRHPAARMVADARGVAPALAELGLGDDEVSIHPGPPVVVQHRPELGEVARLAFVGGRFLGACVAGGEPVSVDQGLVSLAEQAVRTGQIELGGMSFGVDPATRAPVCVGVDTRIGEGPGEADAAVDYVLYRAGRFAPPDRPAG